MEVVQPWPEPWGGLVGSEPPRGSTTMRSALWSTKMTSKHRPPNDLLMKKRNLVATPNVHFACKPQNRKNPHKTPLYDVYAVDLRSLCGRRPIDIKTDLGSRRAGPLTEKVGSGSPRPGGSVPIIGWRSTPRARCPRHLAPCWERQTQWPRMGEWRWMADD